MIYDDPNHPQYGPVRRLHLKLMELFADVDLTAVEQRYEAGIGKDWTEVVASSIAMGVHEAHVARSTISTMLGCHHVIEGQKVADRIAIFPGPCRS